VVELHLLAEVVEQVLVAVQVVDARLVKLDLGLEVVVLADGKGTFLCL
jgi:hypothetical protein